jgi:hypothetical protein
LPGLRVALDYYQKLEPPVLMADIRGHKDALLALRERLQARAGGKPIYFPWIPYRDTIRTFQSYLVSMPSEVISFFPALRALVDDLKTAQGSAPIQSPAEQAMAAVLDAAGKVARRRKGQGFQLDQEVKVAVEVRAMNAAAEFYGEHWDVEDVHGSESYDLICRRDGAIKHVEVKGTVTDGSEVILTPNEVRHAREYPDTALFVLSNIIIGRAADGTITATGGVRHRYDPWHVDDEALRPLGFRYQVPGKETPSGQA